MKRHIAVIYGSAYGQTAKIASRIANVLTVDDLAVTIFNADALGQSFDFTPFDGVVIGSSVIAGKHRKSVRRFVEAHLEALNRLPSAFFSVSGSAASVQRQQQAQARQLMDRFLTTVGWSPDLMTTIGGAVAYTRYSPILRWIMTRIARKEGGPTDTSRDHEMTNWEQVDDFAHHFARVAAPVMFTASAMSAKS